MTTTANKVEFGVSKLFIGTYTEDTSGTVTLGDPVAQLGAVNISLSPEGDSNDFYADNTKYWSGYSENGFTGSIEVAMFNDTIKETFFGYKVMTDGGVAKVKQTSQVKAYVMFQAEGDSQSRRVVLYNVTFGGINREYATTEDSTEPTTESVDMTVTGTTATGVSMAVYDKDSTGYAKVCVPGSKPDAPAFSS